MTTPIVPKWGNASERSARPTGRRVFGPHVCRRCGKPAVAGAKFCAHCGLRLRPKGSAAPPGADDALIRGQRLRERGRAWQRLALRLFRRARKASTSDIEPILEIARTYHLMRRPARARRWYRRALRRRRDCFEAWVEGAETYGRYDHFRRALWLRRAMALRPEDRTVADAFDHHFSKLTSWQRRWIERRLWPLLRHIDPLAGQGQSC